MLFVHCGCLPNRAIACQNHTLSICQDVRACVPLSTDARHRALTPVASSCASCHLRGGRWKWKDTEKRRGKQGGSHQKHRLDRKKIFLCISGILKVRRRREDWINKYYVKLPKDPWQPNNVLHNTTDIWHMHVVLCLNYFQSQKITFLPPSPVLLS